MSSPSAGCFLGLTAARQVPMSKCVRIDRRNDSGDEITGAIAWDGPPVLVTEPSRSSSLAAKARSSSRLSRCPNSSRRRMLLRGWLRWQARCLRRSR